MKLNYWISLPLLSTICLFANANTATPASTTTTTVATPAPAATATAAPVTAPAATSTTALPKKEEAPSVKFKFDYSLGYTIQAQEQPKGTRKQELGHNFTPSMSYGDYSSFAYIGYEQDLIDTSSNGWSDVVLGLSKKSWELSKLLKLGPSIGAVLPLNDSTRNEVGLLYAASAALTLSLNTKTLGWDAWSMSYQANLSKNFLSYDTNAKSGSPNRAYGFRNRFNLGYDITEKISFFTRFDFNSNYTVNGVVTNGFAHFQSLGYTINDVTSVSITHANGGDVLKGGNYENNLKFYDAESSSYSVGLSVSL